MDDIPHVQDSFHQYKISIWIETSYLRKENSKLSNARNQHFNNKKRGVSSWVQDLKYKKKCFFEYKEFQDFRCKKFVCTCLFKWSTYSCWIQASLKQKEWSPESFESDSVEYFNKVWGVLGERHMKCMWNRILILIPYFKSHVALACTNVWQILYFRFECMILLVMLLPIVR